MQKEILTRENIIKDLKCRLFKEMIELVIAIPLIPLTGYFVVNVISPIMDVNQNFKHIIFLICCLLLYTMFIYYVANTFISWIFINKFKVVNDFVIKKLSKRGGLYAFNRPYTLCFASNKKYEIHSGKHYKWSNLFKMSDKEVYDSSNIDDDFYLINIGRQKNIVAYNKKMFEYKDN